MDNFRTPSGRMGQVQTPVIPVVADLIAKNPGTISMGQGVVYYGPPPTAFEKLEMLNQSILNHRYTDTGGLPELRQKLKDKLIRDNNINTSTNSEIVVTAGSNMAFVNTLFAITSPGDEIILNIPYYFNHEMAIRMLSCKAVLIATDKNYLPCLEKLRAAITPRTRAIVTISPNNPSGVIYPESLLSEINLLCKQENIFHISDEAYEYFAYDGTIHFSPGSLPGASDHTITLFSLSKSYGFAGWRIGYMVFPGYLNNAIYKAQDTNLICPAIASQFAAIGALEEGYQYCAEKLQVINDVRIILLAELDRIKSFCSVSNSHGAFYFLIRLDAALDDMQVVERLIRDYRVATLPGSTFGLVDGCYLRIAYGALDKDNARDGIRRLTNGLTDIIHQEVKNNYQ